MNNGKTGHKTQNEDEKKKKKEKKQSENCEDTQELIISCKSIKEIQHKGQKKMDKR